MVFPDEATKIILAKYPQFETYEDYQECLYEGNPVSFYGIMAAFGRYVTDEYINNEDHKMLKEIFVMIENFMVHGDQEVQEAVATCFLENLINVSSHGDFSPLIFTRHLGKESKEYCRAWDKFTGVKTKGLWD